MKSRRITINSFDNFTDEVRMLPDISKELNFSLSPIEAHFFDVADKHGVIDQMLDTNCDWEDEG